MERDKRKLGVFLVMHGDTFPVRRAFDLGSKLKMMYKYAQDLPRQLDTDGKLIPKHEGIVEGWCLLHGDVPDIGKTRDSFRQLVDSHYFSDSALRFQREVHHQDQRLGHL